MSVHSLNRFQIMTPWAGRLMDPPHNHTHVTDVNNFLHSFIIFLAFSPHLLFFFLFPVVPFILLFAPRPLCFISFVFSFQFIVLILSPLVFSPRLQVNEATAKQKPKAEFCFGEFFRKLKSQTIIYACAKFTSCSSGRYSWSGGLFFAVINAVSRRYFLQANDVTDMRDWVAALNKASKITVSYAHTQTHTHIHTPFPVCLARILWAQCQFPEGDWLFLTTHLQTKTGSSAAHSLFDFLFDRQSHELEGSTD